MEPTSGRHFCQPQRLSTNRDRLGNHQGSTQDDGGTGNILLGTDATCEPRRFCCLSPPAPRARLHFEVLGQSARIELHPRGYRGCSAGNLTGPAPEAPHVGRVQASAALGAGYPEEQSYGRRCVVGAAVCTFPSTKSPTRSLMLPIAVASRIDTELVLASLKGRQRDVVVSISIEGGSARQVAARLGMTEVAVRVCLHRALKAMARTFRSDAARVGKSERRVGPTPVPKGAVPRNARASSLECPLGHSMRVLPA